MSKYKYMLPNDGTDGDEVYNDECLKNENLQAELAAANELLAESNKKFAESLAAKDKEIAAAKEEAELYYNEFQRLRKFLLFELLPDMATCRYPAIQKSFIPSIRQEVDITEVRAKEVYKTLKDQLAAKDKEIERLKSCIGTSLVLLAGGQDEATAELCKKVLKDKQ